MSNIVDFHKVTKKSKEAKIAPSSEGNDFNMEMFNALVEYSNEILKMADEAAESAVRKADLSDIEFSLLESPQEYLSDLMDYDGDPDGMVLSYSGTGKDGAEYIMYVTFEADEEDGSVYSWTSLYRTLDGRLEEFGFSDKEDWNHDEDKQKIYEILQEDSAEADFIACLASFVGIPPLMVNPEYVLALLKQNRRLVGLYEAMHGLADFDFDELNEGDIRAYLVADDINRCGGAVYYGGGMFHICQRMRAEDDAEACLRDERNVSGREDGCVNYAFVPREFLHEVYTEKDAGKVRNSLYFFWDHYCCGSLKFCFPLSAHAYAEGEKPYSRLRTYTQYKKRDLTLPEDACLRRLKKFFRLRR